MNSLIYDRWIKINIELHNKLEELNVIEKEKKEIIKEAEEKGMNEEIKIRMDKNIIRYEKLLKEVQALKEKSENLKKELA